MSSIKIINDDVKFPVLLDSSVYTQWRKHVKTYLPKFGQAGKALLTGKRDARRAKCTTGKKMYKDRKKFKKFKWFL